MLEDRSIDTLKKSFEEVVTPPEIDLVIERAIQKGKKRNSNIRKVLSTVAALFIIGVFTGTYTLKSGILNSNNVNLAQGNESNGAMKDGGSRTQGTDQNLPTIKDMDNLRMLLLASGYSKQPMYRGYEEDSVTKSQGVEKATNSNGDGSANYSDTNIQVAGVDEGDIVKTDGKYIYKTNMADAKDYTIDVVSAMPAEEAAVINKIKVNGYPVELYLEGNNLILISNINSLVQNNLKNESPQEYYSINGSISITVYDISDKKNIKIKRELKVDGSIVSSRMIGSRLYVITNKNIYYNAISDNKLSNNVLPVYMDSSIDNQQHYLNPENIQYCPKAVAPNFITAASIDIENSDEDAKITSVLGSGNQIYCSEESLYVSGYNLDSTPRILDNVLGIDTNSMQEAKTEVYKFSLADGNVRFEASAEVQGTIINQFSMDEANNEFRVATTRNYIDNKEKSAKRDNNIYIFDESMKLKGKLENIAEGERIYSTRFIGNRAYMVTFKNVDPLFVIDLSDGSKPKILGELKIPGFSDYLHPYDENHIIGFGLDTEEMTDQGTGSQWAKAKGFKMSIFDVSDVNNPKQEYVTVIGDRGTYSEILRDHKALLFSKEKELLAIPIQVVEGSQPKFSGAYIYNLNLEKGFTLKGTITHTDENTTNNFYDFYGNQTIRRILYIGDNLYTISNNEIKINKISDLSEIKTIK